MKKLILLFLVACFTLAACGSTDESTDDLYFSATDDEAWEDESDWALEDRSEIMQRQGTEDVVESEPESLSSDAASPTSPDVDNPARERATTAEQIAHRANAEILTEDFDTTITLVHELISSQNGFIERSNIAMQNDNVNVYTRRSDGSYSFIKRAAFIIRVPGENYDQMLDGLSDLGEVTSLDTAATNVSARYSDIASRLNALRVQEERLLALLEEAANLTEILELEDRIGDIILQIERLTAERGDLRSQVAYSVVHLSIWEPEEIIDPYDDGSLTAGSAFSNSLQAMGTFIRGGIIVLAALLPWLIALAIVTLPVFLVIRRRNKRSKNAGQNGQNSNRNSRNGIQNTQYTDQNIQITNQNTQNGNRQ